MSALGLLLSPRLRTIAITMLGLVGGLCFALLFLIASLVSTFAALNPFPGQGPGGVPVQALGPVYFASSVNLPGGPVGDPLRLASIHDLGFGPSDATRLERLIASIRPSSPLVGHGEQLLHLGQQFGVDPLLIVLWQPESQMATVGLNVPANGGNMTWEAALPYAATWGCGPGPSSLNHHWAACPNLDAGLGLWMNYVGLRYVDFANLSDFANTYNPCSDPENARNGYPCGDVYGNIIIALLRQHAGPPVAAAPPSAGPPVAGGCAPLLPVGDAEANLALPPGVPEIMARVWGGRGWPVTHGWGYSSLSGEPPWLGYPHFHAGIDFGAPAGTPLYAPAGGIARPAVRGSMLIQELHLDNGYVWHFLHLSVQSASGPVAPGQLLGRSGNTGYSTGPHLHLELRDPSGGYVAPEEWSCRTR